MLKLRKGFPEEALCFYHQMAEPTGLEPATSDVTGRRSNQLNYDSAKTQRTDAGCQMLSNGLTSDIKHLTW